MVFAVAAGGNKSAHSSTGANLRKLEEETEDFHGAWVGGLGPHTQRERETDESCDRRVSIETSYHTD